MGYNGGDSKEAIKKCDWFWLLCGMAHLYITNVVVFSIILF